MASISTNIQVQIHFSENVQGMEDQIVFYLSVLIPLSANVSITINIWKKKKKKIGRS